MIRQRGFSGHAESAAAKVNRTVTALARLMPNIGGSKQGKRPQLMRDGQRLPTVQETRAETLRKCQEEWDRRLDPKTDPEDGVLGV